MKFHLVAAVSAAVIIGAIGCNNIAHATEKTAPAVAKAKDGYTVEELFAKKGDLKGKKVTVRGKAVKFNGGIMGKNWVHLQDGTGKAGTNDITVTTSQTAQLGDVVVATGVMATDKDFGGGYIYDVIIEDASLKIEKQH